MAKFRESPAFSCGEFSLKDLIQKESFIKAEVDLFENGQELLQVQIVTRWGV